MPGRLRTDYNESRPPAPTGVGYTRRIRPPMLPAGRIGDVRGAGKFYFRAVLKQVQAQSERPGLKRPLVALHVREFDLGVRGRLLPRPPAHAIKPELPVIGRRSSSTSDRLPCERLPGRRMQFAKRRRGHSCLLKEEARFRAIQRADKNPAIEKSILLLAGSLREKCTGMASSQVAVVGTLAEAFDADRIA